MRIVRQVEVAALVLTVTMLAAAPALRWRRPAMGA